MDRWVGKVAVVTGASAGIGLATTQALFSHGMIVVGLARRKETMESSMKGIQGKGKFYAVECDVSKDDNVEQAFAWIKKNLGMVHVLVNNAGIMLPGGIIDTTRKDWEKVMNVNIMGLLMCTKVAVNMMKEAGIEGHIININSIAGHRVFRVNNHRSNVYAATKHAVTALTQTLTIEMLGTKIRTTSISPGYVKTEIMQANNADFASLAELPALKSEDVAEAIVYVLGTPQRVQITELTIKPLGETFY